MNSVSLNQIAYNLLNSLRGGRTTSSEHISLEQIKHVIKYYRALFIRRDGHRNVNRFHMFEQDLKYLDLQTIDSAEDTILTSGNLLKRTTKKVPTPVRLKRNLAFTYIGSVGKQDIPIPLIDSIRAPWQQYGKYTSRDVFASYRNGYIYVENDITISKLHVRGVFEDPEQVHTFTRENGFDLYDEDSPFPISSDMLEGIVKGILQGELTMMLETQTDTTTDTLQSP